jgi:hypothetical protein
MSLPNMETRPCRVYKMGGRFFVPHHHKRNVYVAPGNVEMSVTDLDNLEAERVELELWVRPWAVKAKLQRASLQPAGAAA